MKIHTNRLLMAGAAASFLASVPAQAQKATTVPPPAAPAAAAPAGQPAVAPTTIPSPEHLVALIRNTLMAVNHANLTGNYSVLRDLGAPGFKTAQSLETLSKSFEGFRNAQIDTAITAAVIPQLTRAPVLDGAAGVLRLTGYYPTRPQVNFDIAYQLIGNRWQHLGIAMSTGQPAPAPVAQAPAPTSPIQTGSVKPADTAASPAPAAAPAPVVKKK